MKLSFRKQPPAGAGREGTLVCVECRREEPLPAADLAAAMAALAERTDCRTLYSVVTLFGFCGECRLAPREPRA
jgi:Fe2+ or Zn2+ uptake regulation protein